MDYRYLEELTDAKIRAFSKPFGIDHLKSMLSEMLESSMADYASDAHQMARVLRLTGKPLHHFDIDNTEIQISTSGHFGGDRHTYHEENSNWLRLHDYVDFAHPEDALVIFGAMAEVLKGEPASKSTTLMSLAVNSPEWSVKAIRKFPDLFLSEMDGASSEQEYRDVFELFGAKQREGKPTHSYESALNTIQALKEIGAKSKVSYGKKASTILHCGALTFSPPVFAAIVKEFPDYMDQRDVDHEYPIHYAASSKHAENVKILLEAGATPRPINKFGDCPLHCAICWRRFDAAIMLMMANNYSDDDIQSISQRAGANDEEKRTIELAFSALKAERIIQESDAAHLIGLTPL